MASLSTLPPEILEEIVERLYESESDPRRGLRSLSLAAKKFCLPAQKKSMQNLYCSVRKARLLTRALSSYNPNGSMIRSLQLSGYDFLLTSELQPFEDNLDLETFIQLMELVPNLSHLSLEFFDDMLSLEVDSIKLPLFPELVSLTLSFNSGTIFERDPITQFFNARSSPQLKDLRLNLPSSCFLAGLPKFTSSTFPIHLLNIQGEGEVDLLRIPIESFVGCEVINVVATSSSLLQVVKVAGPTLQTLRLFGTENYASISSLFPYLTVLKSLLVAKLTNLPNDFFQHCPSSIIELELLDLKPKHIEHLHSYPRPSLRLKSLTLYKSVSKRVFEILPYSITTLILRNTRRIEISDIYQTLLRRNPRPLLNKIHYTVHLDIEDGLGLAESIADLASLGIEVEVNESGAVEESDSDED